MKTTHIFLVQDDELSMAVKRTNNFILRNGLVSYDHHQIDEDDCLNGTNPKFYEILKSAVQKNNDVITCLLKELASEGYIELQHLAQIPQGYLSKIVHTIAHLLDGFFGIDTYFYNLEEDSHRVSFSLFKKIKENPGQYWLIQVIGLLAEDYQGFEKPF